MLKFQSAAAVLAVLVLLTFVVADAREYKEPIRSTKDPFDPSIPNPPKFVQPLGACEVPYLSLKSIKKELRKRNTVCTTCAKKEDYQRLLIERINDWTPVLTDEEYEAALAKDAIGDSQQPVEGTAPVTAEAVPPAAAVEVEAAADL